MTEGIVTPDLPGIAAVERDTGLAKDTLRMWERRYGFPAPLRDAAGERLYPTDQVEKLRLIRRLLDRGYRPGKIIPLPPAELVRIAEEAGGTALAVTSHIDTDAVDYIELLRRHQTEDLRQAMQTRLVRMGLERFVIDVVAPLAIRVGDAWACGELAVFEEHLFTEQTSALLRNALNTLPRAKEGTTRPRLLLTTLPQESHGLGLLMAEALLSLHGCACVSLGLQTPLRDIAMAAEAHAIDIVALSFSPCMGGKQVVEGLLDLRHQLPRGIGLWAGGSHPVLSRRNLTGIRVLRHLSDIEPAVLEWRDNDFHPT